MLSCFPYLKRTSLRKVLWNIRMEEMEETVSVRLVLRVLLVDDEMNIIEEPRLLVLGMSGRWNLQYLVFIDLFGWNNKKLSKKRIIGEKKYQRDLTGKEAIEVSLRRGHNMRV